VTEGVQHQGFTVVALQIDGRHEVVVMSGTLGVAQ